MGLQEKFDREMANAQSMVTESAHSMGDNDELRREIARLNDELERFKGKYFDAEQKKIELADQVEDSTREKYQLEEKNEELKGDMKKLQRQLEEAERRAE